MSLAHLTRRGFLRGASAGAAGLVAGWGARLAPAAIAAHQQAASGLPLSEPLIDDATFRRLCETILDDATSDQTLIALTDSALATTSLRDGSGGHTSSTRRGISLSISTAFGNRHATVEIHELGQEAALRALRDAEKAAEGAKEDPDYLPPLGPQRYPILPTYRRETDLADDARRARDAAAIARICADAGVAVRQGLVTASVTARGVAASTGLFAYDRETAAGFQFIAFRPDNNESAGMSAGQSRSVDDLDPAGAAREAVQRLAHLRRPIEFEDGRYVAVLAPSAVAGLTAALIAALGKSRGRNPLASKLGAVVADARLRLQNRPDHPDLLGRRFDDRGAPADYQSWIADGKLIRLAGVASGGRGAASSDAAGALSGAATTQPAAGGNGEPSPSREPYPLDAPHLSLSETAADSLEGLIASTQRGVLVPAVEHVRTSVGADLPASGRASAGFLIEDGQITGGISAPAFRDGILRAFSAIDAATPATGAMAQSSMMVVPALRVADFAFRA